MKIQNIFLALLVALIFPASASAGAEWLGHVMCAQELNKVHPPTSNKSEYHIVEGAVLTSLERPSQVGESMERVLILVTPTLFLEYPLPSAPTVKAKVTVPNFDPRRPGKIIYFTYSHSEVQGNYFRISRNPAGAVQSADFVPLMPRVPVDRGSEQQLLSSINGKLANIRSRVNTGVIQPAALFKGNMSLCQGLDGSYPNMASHIDRSVQALARRSSRYEARPGRGTSRIPASIPTPVSLHGR